VLPRHVGASRSALTALQRHFANVRTLQHPHIAQVHELGCVGERYVVRGERLDGWELREVLARLLPERLDVSEADDIVRAIGSALVYAHGRGIAHGDVRAENVIVTMDHRVVLTNFLARRTAKVAAQPPRPGDDVRGLARLAAELYTGGVSPQDLRGSVGGTVPAARLAAIRGVLEGPARRRAGTVTDFLAAAGLVSASAGAEPQPSWSAWQESRSRWRGRVMLSLAAVVAVGALAASYYSAGREWRESALLLQQRGLDALRGVTARPPPTNPAATLGGATPAPAPAEATATPSSSEAGETLTEPPATPAPGAPAPPAAAPGVTASVPPLASEPSVLSLGATRVNAREDHSVVAIDVVRSGDTTQETAVGWWTSPDTAHEDDDYANIGGQTVTFRTGATVERLLIPIVNDGVRESDEVFTVHLSRPRGGVTGSVTATRVTLLDDD
jgi:Calx-beta domain/Protein tyrosine and serine/threonine kinase